jgi:hypothetical protein
MEDVQNFTIVLFFVVVSLIATEVQLGLPFVNVPILVGVLVVVLGLVIYVTRKYHSNLTLLGSYR